MELTADASRISRRSRLLTMLLDHFVMCFLIVPPLILIKIIFGFNQPFQTHPIETISFFFMALIYLNKDFIRGKSPSKRLLGFQVIDRQTGTPANELQCFLRNITIPIWPLEVLFSLFSPKRRLGDLIANTRLERSNKEEISSLITDFKSKKLSKATIWTLAIGILYMIFLWYLSEAFLNIN